MQLSRCYKCMKDFDIEIDYICPHCGYDQHEQEGDPEKRHALKPGTILNGKYYIGKVLGIGGCAITYVSYNLATKTKVAVKEFFPSSLVEREVGSSNVDYGYGDDAEQFKLGLEQFEKEFRQLAKVGTHQGIVDIFEAFAENNTAYIAMEYVEGNTLADYMLSNGVMDYNELLKIIIPICESLHKIHINDEIIHRDIAPDNIMLQPNGKAKLIDFGASLRDSQVNENIILKHGYAPIEQYDVDDKSTGRTDIYAMSAVIYHLITGKRPPRSDKRKEEVSHGNPDPLLTFAQLGYAVPEKLNDIVMKGLSIEPEDRIANMEILASELSALIEIPPPPPPEKKPIWKLVLSIAAPLVVIITVIAVMLLRPSDEVTVDYGEILDLGGMTVQEAEQKVSEMGNEIQITFKIVESDTVHSNDKSKEGTIAMQNPKAGSKITEDDVVITVNVYEYDKDIDDVGDKKIEMPDLKNKTQSEAENLLAQSGLSNYSFEHNYNENVPSGSVYKQSVKGGTEVMANTQITVYISDGPKPTTTVATTIPRTNPPATKPQSGGFEELPDDADKAEDAIGFEELF